MPTYQYKCKSCGHEFEEVQKFSDDTLTKCPKCKKKSLVRVIGSAGLVFKGSGFYLTDYKKAEDKKSEDKKSDSKSEAPPAPPSPPEKKPKSKSEPKSTEPPSKK